MVEIVKTIQGFFDPNVLVENVFLFSVLSVFLVMYGPRLHIKLPSSVRSLFDNALFRGVVLFLIVYMSNSDFVGALTITVIFIVTINVLQSTEILSKVTNLVTMENFSANGPPVANCETYTDNNTNKLGTVYYPLNDSENAENMRSGNNGTEQYSSTVNFGQ